MESKNKKMIGMVIFVWILAVTTLIVYFHIAPSLQPVIENIGIGTNQSSAFNIYKP